jgi:hypothetical protein
MYLCIIGWQMGSSCARTAGCSCTASSTESTVSKHCTALNVASSSSVEHNGRLRAAVRLQGTVSSVQRLTMKMIRKTTSSYVPEPAAM